MAIEKQTDRVEQAEGRLITQYKETETTKAIVKALNEDSQDKEDTAYDLYTLRWLDEAEGQQLDNYGEDLDVFRQGFDDDTYRAVIKGTIVRYQSSGQRSRIIDAFKLITGVQTVYIKNAFPAGFEITGIFAEGDSLLTPPIIVRETLRNAKAAGVAIRKIILGEELVFAYQGFPGPSAGYNVGKYATSNPDLVPTLRFGYQGAPNVGGYSNTGDPLTGGRYFTED